MGNQANAVLGALVMAASLYLYRRFMLWRLDRRHAAFPARRRSASTQYVSPPPRVIHLPSAAARLNQEALVADGAGLGRGGRDDVIVPLHHSQRVRISEIAVPAAGLVPDVDEPVAVISSGKDSTARQLFDRLPLADVVIERKIERPIGSLIGSLIQPQIQPQIEPLIEPLIELQRPPSLTVVTGAFDPPVPRVRSALLDGLRLGEPDKETALREEGELPVTPAELTRRQRDFDRMVCWLVVVRGGEAVPLTDVCDRLGREWSLARTLLHARTAARARHLVIDTPDPLRWTERLSLTEPGDRVLAAQMSVPPDPEH